MKYKEAVLKHRKELKQSRILCKKDEKFETKRAKLRKRVCEKIGCNDCIALRTDCCLDFVKDESKFKVLLDWIKGIKEK